MGVGGRGAHRAVMTFHHILSSKKISTLHAWATDLELMGLIKTGYPGLLLLVDRAHGGASSVSEYTRRVKRLPWQTCELRTLEPVPDIIGDARCGAPAMLGGLEEVLAGASGAGRRMSRRSGLVELERVKDIAPVLRKADAAAMQRAKAAAEPRPAHGWELFYSQAMRGG